MSGVVPGMTILFSTTLITFGELVQRRLLSVDLFIETLKVLRDVIEAFLRAGNIFVH